MTPACIPGFSEIQNRSRIWSELYRTSPRFHMGGSVWVRITVTNTETEDSAMPEDRNSKYPTQHIGTTIMVVMMQVDPRGRGNIQPVV